jgi:hypothetical protein
LHGTLRVAWRGNGDPRGSPAGQTAPPASLAVCPSDLQSFSVTVPNDPRLPNAGSTITNLLNINPTSSVNRTC